MSQPCLTRIKSALYRALLHSHKSVNGGLGDGLDDENRFAIRGLHLHLTA
jgi:hypothetical protein